MQKGGEVYGKKGPVLGGGEPKIEDFRQDQQERDINLNSPSTHSKITLLDYKSPIHQSALSKTLPNRKTTYASEAMGNKYLATSDHDDRSKSNKIRV